MLLKKVFLAISSLFERTLVFNKNDEENRVAFKEYIAIKRRSHRK